MSSLTNRLLKTKSLHIVRYICALFLLSCIAQQGSAQAINDFGSISTGSWTNATIWRQWDGTGWNTVPASYPTGPAVNVYILAGTTVTMPTGISAPSVFNLTIEATAKLFTNNISTNAYINVYGTNLVCNGEIGNGALFDGISFNFEGVTTTVSGIGTFNSARFRKSAVTNLITTLVIAMNVTLRWDQVSNTQLYNNTATASRFNVTVNAGCTLNCAGSPTSPGNLTIDGVSGTGAADAGGTITVNGTLLVPGILFAASNNPTNVAYTTATGTVGTNTITVSQTVGLAVGQTVAGTGIAVGATITAIAGSIVTLSLNNTGAVTGGAISIFSLAPPTLTGNVGQSTVTVSSSAGLYVGQSISGTGIASGAMITAISGNTLTLSATNISPVSGYATIGNSCNFVIGNGGLIRAGQVYSPAGTAAGFMNFTVQSGGKLELTGANGFPAGTTNYSNTNNRYNFQTGSTVEYSAAAAQNVLTQLDFTSSVTAQNQYWHLIISGTGNKTIRTGTLTVRGDLTITGGSAVLDQTVNNTPIAIGGNWSNYNQSGFRESTSLAAYVRFINSQAIQTITCPLGEEYYNLQVAKTTGKVQQLSPVTVTNQLTLGQAGLTSYGILDLNGNPLTINNPLPTGINLIGSINATTNYRFILSERTDNASVVNWRIGTSTGSYVIPFGISATVDTIPFFYNKTAAGDIGLFSVATYGTPATNLPWPTTPVSVTNLNPFLAGVDNRNYTVDRFWYLGASTPVVAGDMTFTYNNRGTSELPTADPVPGNLLAQYWNTGNPSWQRPQVGAASVVGYPAASVTVTGISSFNTAWTLASQTSPLPIELLRFDASSGEKDVFVSWITATELNNEYFDVERSVDGDNFITIGRVAGAGNSSSERYYDFIDTEPLSGVSYYRLRQVDYDGKTSLSELVAVDRNRTSSKGYTLSPNPAADHIVLSSTAVAREALTVRIIDMGGRTVITQQCDFSVSVQRVLEVKGLSRGIYSVVLEGVYTNEHFRLVKD